MTIDKVMNNLYDALSKNQDTIWFDYQGFRWELGHDLSFHPRHILHPGNCSEDRRAAQYSYPSHTIQNQKTNVYAGAYYDRQNK